MVALIEILSPSNKDRERHVADSLPQAYLEHRNVGEDLLDMPLFLTPDHYVLTPLRTTYQAAFHGLPEFWQRELNKNALAD